MDTGYGGLPSARTPGAAPTQTRTYATATSPAGSPGTVIIGAGIAGLACARRLHKAGHPFLVISENIGGRICRSRDGRVNLGAYYVRADYDHVNQFVRLGRRINTLRTLRHDRDGAYTFLDRRVLFHVPQAMRFLTMLLTFRRHYEVLKSNCLIMSQAEAIRSDPYLYDLYRQPAVEFIRQNRLKDIARHYLTPSLHGTAFSPPEELSAFILLLTALPFLVPIYEFTFRLDAMVDGFSHALMRDSVASITQHDVGYRINTQSSGSLVADRVVVATPPHVSQRLLGLPDIKGPACAHMFELVGSLREPFSRADINLFSGSDPTLAIARQPDSSILFCSRELAPDLDRYLTSWEVIEHKPWSPAFRLKGHALLECRLTPDLYLIGDHNICGLEDAYLTGLFAARQIVRSTEASMAEIRGSLQGAALGP